MGAPLPRRIPKPRSPKQCRKCQEWLPIECFDRKADSPDFHATECRACKWERKTPTRLVREEKLRAALRRLLDAINENTSALTLYSMYDNDSCLLKRVHVSVVALCEAKSKAERLLK